MSVWVVRFWARGTFRFLSGPTFASVRHSMPGNIYGDSVAHQRDRATQSATAACCRAWRPRPPLAGRRSGSPGARVDSPYGGRTLGPSRGSRRGFRRGRHPMAVPVEGVSRTARLVAVGRVHRGRELVVRLVEQQSLGRSPGDQRVGTPLSGNGIRARWRPGCVCAQQGPHPHTSLSCRRECAAGLDQLD